MKLFTKIFLSVFCFVFVIVATLSFIFIRNQVLYAEEELIKQSETTGEFLSKQVEIGYLQSQLPYESLSKLTKVENFLFWWVVKDDDTIYRSNDASFMGTKALDYFPEIANISSDESVYVDEANGYGIYLGNLKIGSSDWRFWFGFSMKGLEVVKKNIYIYSVLVFILTTSALALALYFIVLFFLRPIKSLSEGAKEIAKGNLNYTVKVSAKDEIGELTSTFNGMINDLRLSRGKLEDYAKNLEAKVEERTSELANKNDELVRLNKLLEALKVKTDFLHVINHQLRTPISAMRGYLDFWRTGAYMKFTPKKQEEMKENIIIASDQLANIVNNMVDALELEVEGKAISLDLEKINLKQLVEEIYKVDFEQRFKAKKLVFELKSDKDPVVQSDKGFVTNVISNLIDDALKYTLTGKVMVTLKSDGNIVSVNVQDTGIGMIEADRATLFQKFTRSQAATKISPAGSGLGLFIVKKIVEILHGEITVASEGLNKGTAFTFKLPKVYVVEKVV
jgi:signal transduction histidine kinase